ncbi:Ribosomal protein S4/S9 [Metarhizium rileyi]|uniref:Mitochondrial 37S ribosomal protein nam9 n=1 Tax=Metarhizium rileyi (strain RCEF 4871) TaxID=1649241 RepID=A0A167EV53_METRR|nr:Ribosomal protein S4/S9 [Metarhizium rileyi RCEF 4871]TWU75528.1 mitochondrial 37S ribosomal protein nam9 [Metarhizium rileyi]
MRKPYRFYSLNRPKLRQSWNKYNLYNMYRNAGREPQIRGTPTFFQQKWAAKSKTRAYHGEHIPEKKWVRLFSRRLLSAVDLPPEYLAAHDGSEQAAGRGSGLTTSNITAESFSRVPKPSIQERSRRKPPPFGDVNKLLSDQFKSMTPYMQMTFAPLERRLDTAVFRALFASSVRQARQFVIHGAVKVNGKKMVHPSYQLNPGDMFQVDIDKVMYGTGQQKSMQSDKRLAENLSSRKKKAEAFYQAAIHKAAASATPVTPSSETASEGERHNAEATSAEEATEEQQREGAEESGSSTGLESLGEEETWKLNNRALKFLLKDVKKILKNNPKELSAKEKKQLRLFRTDAKRFLSRPEDSALDVQELIEELQLQMKSHELMRESFEKLTIAPLSPDTASETPAAEAESQTPEYNRQRQINKGLDGLTEEQKTKAMRIMGESQLSREEMRKLARLLQYDEENPIDDSKSYATPWRPRPFMSAFAFIPRYLEVNPNICAAVYLRHPVARKGMAEVPTPFSYLTSQLTHNWYLERG